MALHRFILFALGLAIPVSALSAKHPLGFVLACKSSLSPDLPYLEGSIEIEQFETRGKPLRISKIVFREVGHRKLQELVPVGVKSVEVDPIAQKSAFGASHIPWATDDHGTKVCWSSTSPWGTLKNCQPNAGASTKGFLCRGHTCDHFNPGSSYEVAVTDGQGKTVRAQCRLPTRPGTVFVESRSKRVRVVVEKQDTFTLDSIESIRKKFPDPSFLQGTWVAEKNPGRRVRFYRQGRRWMGQILSWDGIPEKRLPFPVDQCRYGNGEYWYWIYLEEGASIAFSRSEVSRQLKFRLVPSNQPDERFIRESRI